MECRRCAACEQAFRPRAQVPRQRFCGEAACQRERRRRWQQCKRQGGVAGAQELQEVQPALAAGRAEPGEIVVADLRADGIGAAMARAGVVHRDPIRRLQAGPQHLTVFRQEFVLSVDQQAHDLALGDGDADRLQLRD